MFDRKMESAAADDRAQRFGEALRLAMAAAGVTQIELAGLIDKKSQGGVSLWVNGRGAPPPDVVFAIEEKLDVKPGSLSKHLGYVPAGVPSVATTVERAVDDDAALDDDQKQSLLGIYRSFVTMRPPGRSRRA